MKGELSLPISRLPLDIKELLTKHFDSVFQLEVLFLFFDHPNREMNADEVCKELRSSIANTKTQLHNLQQQGFIKSSSLEKYLYIPSEAVEKLYHAYHERPVAIISFLYEKPNETLKSFADAFKLKKD